VTATTDVMIVVPSAVQLVAPRPQLVTVTNDVVKTVDVVQASAVNSGSSRRTSGVYKLAVNLMTSVSLCQTEPLPSDPQT